MEHVSEGEVVVANHRQKLFTNINELTEWLKWTSPTEFRIETLNKQKEYIIQLVYKAEKE